MERTGFVDLDHWLDHDGGDPIPWDELGDAMVWTASEEETREPARVATTSPDPMPLRRMQTTTRGET